MKYILFTLWAVLLWGSCKSIQRPYESENKILQESFTYQDRDRTYWVYIPAKNKLQSPAPLLFHLHGGGGTGKSTPNLTYNQFNKIADREGIIVVYPDAIERNWNDGRSQNIKPKNKDVDDVGFIVEIINTLKQKHSIDDSKIFTTGMSNGGFMSTRLLCDRADVFRGGAILTASISEEYLPLCNPEMPVAVLVMNGTADPIVPYKGGNVRLYKNGKSRGKVLSNDDFLQFWQSKNNCDASPSNIDLPNKDKKDGTTVQISTYSNCKSRGALQFYKIDGGGHTWPGSRQYLNKRIIGNTSREINACDEIWTFFSNLR
ncbi:MAG: PHB depolymerase family esterase [Saprospiraceae bacterium]|nr:PHB depolymerase family esterase [Saprospiraceae bacterium]